MKRLLIFILTIIFLGNVVASFAQIGQYEKKIDQAIDDLLKESKTPGMAISVVNGNETLTRTYGYANKKKRTPVVASTLFEIGSCTKAFTALAILKLQKEGKLNLSQNVTTYIPWFKSFFEDHEVNITINNFLHHTSGIPWSAIDYVDTTNTESSLINTVRRISGIELKYLPGDQYEYSTVNYDVLGLIIQSISGQPYEDFMDSELLPLIGLKNTFAGGGFNPELKSTGYKMSYFRPLEYDIPMFKGNLPAGYIVSNINDMTSWLKSQMGLRTTELDSLIDLSHIVDDKVAPHQLSYYAKGWNVSLMHNGVTYHEGLNPNFSSYMSFDKSEKKGVVVLSNSNNLEEIKTLADNIIHLLKDEPLPKVFDPGSNYDKTFTILSIFILFFLLSTFLYFLYAIYGVVSGKRQFNRQSESLSNIFIMLIILAPFLYGLYILPRAMGDISWTTITIWMPQSFTLAITLVVTSTLFACFVSLFTTFFPERDRFRRELPGVFIISTISGMSNMILIILITTATGNDEKLAYILFYFAYSFILYIVSRRYIQIRMLKYTRDLIFDIRLKLISKIFATSYDKFEKLERGRILTAINDDVGTIGGSASMFIVLLTNIITTGAAFVYLATIAFWATLMTFLLIILISAIYYFVSKSSTKLFEQGRDTRETLNTLFEGMIYGNKELSIHKSKKSLYMDDIRDTEITYKQKMIKAEVNFTNAFMVGESLLIMVLGMVAFMIPLLFPDIQPYVIMGFIVILLYLIGPINAILRSVPGIVQFRVSWNRIKKFSDEIPSNQPIEDYGFNGSMISKIDSLEIKNLEFVYTKSESNFSVGPIDLELKAGEVLFIIGGNGSGKSTLAKLLTGLYTPDRGCISIEGKDIDTSRLGEYYAAVFSPTYLFKKLYNTKTEQEQEKIQAFLKVLGMEDKVSLSDNQYSTLDLSNGQRKRLALLQCYLEDRPIFLFDEWAADQDPEYKRFFYRELIPKMKEQKKIVIAITHDDNYFDIADKIVKMDTGKMNELDRQFLTHI